MSPSYYVGANWFCFRITYLTLGLTSFIRREGSSRGGYPCIVLSKGLLVHKVPPSFSVTSKIVLVMSSVIEETLGLRR